MTVAFSPDSYRKAGQAFSSEGESFTTSAETLLGGMDINALGCNNNGTLADAAFAVVFPLALEALQETAAGLGGGFSALGEGLNQTATAYCSVEEVNTQTASDSKGE